MAARIPTLPAAVTPVVVGSAAAWAHGRFIPAAFFAALISSVLIQVGTNFANDLIDFKKGADTEESTGPLRGTQARLVTPGQMDWAMCLSSRLTVDVGHYPVYP